MSHLYCFVFNQDHGRVLRVPLCARPNWHAVRQKKVAESETSETGRNGQRVNDIICPLDNPIEVIRLLNFWISSARMRASRARRRWRLPLSIATFAIPIFLSSTTIGLCPNILSYRGMRR